MKPYHCHTKETDISYPETTNDLAEKPTDKPANKEVPTPLDHLKPQRPRQQGRSRKSHFTNDLMDEMADIFISHRECADYKLALKLRHDGIITTPGDLFEQSDLTEIESLLANNVSQPLQYNSNKHTVVSLFKSCLVHEIKEKDIDK